MLKTCTHTHTHSLTHRFFGLISDLVIRNFGGKPLSYFAHTAIAKRHRLGILNNRHLLTHVLGARSPWWRCLHIQFLVKAFFLACRRLPLSCVLTWPLLSPVEKERSLVSLPLLTWTAVLPYYGPTLMSSFNFNYLPKDPISKYDHIVG